MAKNTGRDKKLSVAIPEQLYQYLRNLVKVEEVLNGRKTSVSALVRKALTEKYMFPEISIDVKETNKVLEQCTADYLKVRKK